MVRRGMNWARRVGGARGSNIAVAFGAKSRLLYALTGFSASSYFATASGGGEAGAASSVGMISMIRVRGIAPAAHNRFASRVDGTHGWQQYMLTSGLLIGYFTDGSGAWKQSGGVQLTTSDIGRVLIFMTWIDAAGVIHGATSRLGQVTTAGTVIVGYTPYAGPHSIGTDPGSTANASNLVDVIAHATFSGAPTDPQFQAYFDAARALGDLQATIGGGTMRHRWSLREQLLGVVNPAGRNTYGARGWLGGNYLGTAAGAATGIGAVSSVSFYAQAHIKVESIIAATGAYIMGRTQASQRGFIGNINTVINGQFGNGSALIMTPQYTLLSTDLGRKVVVTIAYDRPAGMARLFLDGTEVGAGTAIADYLAYQDPTFGMFQLGRVYVFQGPGSPFTCFQAGGGNFLPSAAQLRAQALAAEVSGKLVPLAGLTDHFWDIDAAIQANGGVVPASIPDLIGSDPMVKTGTLETGIYVDTAPPAPAQLTDTVTLATGDALARVGAPRVVPIDTSIDGRVTKGVLGFGVANSYDSAVNAGIRGSNSFWVEVSINLWAVPASGEIFLSCTDAAIASGWYFQIQSGSLRVAFRTSSNTYTSATYTVTAADLGKPFHVLGQFTGTGVRAIVNGVPTGSDTATAGTYVTPAGLAMHLGKWEGGQPFMSGSLLGVSGGNGSPTFAQSAAAAKACLDAGGRVTGIAGLTDHLYDLTLDIVANNGVLPVQVLDRIGTDHLARLDIDTPKVGPNGVRGVGPYSATDLWTTAAGGGLQGANTMHVVVDIVFAKVATAGNEMPVHCANSGQTAGWFLQMSPAGLLTASIAGVKATSSYQLIAGDVNARKRVVINKTATVVQLWINGVQVGTDQAAASYNAPSSVAMVIGQLFGTQVFTSGWVELVEGGNFLLTPAEIATLNADLTVAAPVIAGKTQKRYCFHDDTSSTPTKTPRASVERVSGSDSLTRYGAGLQVAQRVEHPWSYETSPIMKAGNAPSSANRWEGATSLETGGSPSGFYVGLLTRGPRNTTTGRVVANGQGGTQGWAALGLSGTQLQFAALDGGGVSRAAPVIFPGASDGKTRAALWVFDSPSNLLRSYHNRAQVGSGTAMTGYNLAGLGSLGLTFGAFYSGTSPQPDWDVIGLVYGLSVPTLAQFQAWEDATQALEDIVAIDGATHMYSFKRGMSGLNLLDLIGSYNIPAVGAPTVTDIYARAWSR